MKRRHLLLAASAVALVTDAHHSASSAQSSDEALEQEREIALYRGSSLVIGGLIIWLVEKVSEAQEAYGGDLSDPAWRIVMLAPFSVAEAALVQAQDLTPPTIFLESHEHLVSCLELLNKAGNHSRLAIFNEAASEWDIAAQYFAQANDELGLAIETLPFTPNQVGGQ
jgi:hypothetical protein